MKLRGMGENYPDYTCTCTYMSIYIYSFIPVFIFLQAHLEEGQLSQRSAAHAQWKERHYREWWRWWWWKQMELVHLLVNWACTYVLRNISGRFLVYCAIILRFLILNYSSRQFNFISNFCVLFDRFFLYKIEVKKIYLLWSETFDLTL